MNGNNRIGQILDGSLKSKKSVRRQAKFSKSADVCPECAGNGAVPPQAKQAPPQPVCHCFKCQPPDNKKPVKDEQKPVAVVISAEGDSSTSRSTLKGRARSWPLLVQPDGSKEAREPHLGLPSPVAQVRRLLWRHYYPEGGWGYIVVACCVLVQMLNHGLQLSYGVLTETICQRFEVGLQETGEHFKDLQTIRTSQSLATRQFGRAILASNKKWVKIEPVASRRLRRNVN